MLLPGSRCYINPKRAALPGGQEGCETSHSQLWSTASLKREVHPHPTASALHTEGGMWTGDTSPPVPLRHPALTLQVGYLVYRLAPTQVTHIRGQSRCHQEHEDKGNVHIGGPDSGPLPDYQAHPQEQALTIPQRRAAGPAHGWHRAHELSPHKRLLLIYFLAFHT